MQGCSGVPSPRFRPTLEIPATDQMNIFRSTKNVEGNAKEEGGGYGAGDGGSGGYCAFVGVQSRRFTNTKCGRRVGDMGGALGVMKRGKIRDVNMIYPALELTPIRHTISGRATCI